MLEVNILVLEVIVFLSINVIIFLYSVVSTDLLITSLAFLLYLVLLIPFYMLMEKIKLQLAIYNIENSLFYEFLTFYSGLINTFIGISLFIELLYLFFYC